MILAKDGQTISIITVLVNNNVSAVGIWYQAKSKQLQEITVAT